MAASVSVYLSALHSKERQHAIVTQQLINAKLAASHDDGIGLVSLAISLNCPLNRQRIETPIRSKQCSHLQCFDAAAYFHVVCKKSLDNWKCPVCNDKAPFRDLVIDDFMVSLLEQIPKNAHQVEFLRDGTWRAKHVSSTIQTTLKGNSLETVDLTFSPEPQRQSLVIDLTTSPVAKDLKFSDHDVIDLTTSP